jgi:hypothetical protein
MDHVDTYVAFDQICRRRIGEVLEVFAHNPAIVKPPRRLEHRPTANGIQIYEASGLLTVFVRYLIPAEEFTTFPYIASRTYLRGDIVYLGAQGECYQAIRAAQGFDPATEISYWRRCQFPAVLAQYVQLGTYADCLRETDTSDERDPVMLQIRGQRAAQANADAEEEINRQCARLQAQGQHYHYLPFGVVVRRAMHGAGALCHIPGYVLQGGGAYDYGPIYPAGAGATTISDQCETEWGYIPPAPITGTSAVAWEYHPEIVSLRGPEPSLAALATSRREVGSLVQIVLTVDAGGAREASSWEMRPGAADPADAGHVAPFDYSLNTNNKHWAKVV